MRLATDEFIRRFLIHVLPDGFHRIRHYGLMASANRKANIAKIRTLLGVPQPASTPETAAEPAPLTLREPCSCCGAPIRSAPGKVCLELQIDAPQRVIFSKLDMAYRDIHIFANKDTFCVGKRICADYYFWFGAEIKVTSNRFRGAAVRVDEPSALVREWNEAGKASVRRPILRQDGEKSYLEFKTSGFPSIEAGFFSTAFLASEHMAMDSYSGVLHYESGISFANRVGDFWLGSTFFKNATLSAVRTKFRGSGPASFHNLASSFF